MSRGIGKWVRVRIILVGLGLGLLALTVGGRFVQLQVIMGAQLKEEADRESQRLCPVLPVRGNILDCRGTELAVSTRVYSLVAHPGQIKNASRLGRELAPVLGFSTQEITELLTRPKSFVWVKRHLTPEKEEAVRAWQAREEKISRAQMKKNPSERPDEEIVYLLPEARRYYPLQALAGPVLGFCNIDGQGLEGLEYHYDTDLYGKPKKARKLLDARGRIVVDGEKVWDAEVMGHNVVLTLDRTLQYIAEKELAKGVKQWEAMGGQVLVVRPPTGEILALAQLPTMDPNRPVDYTEESRRNRPVTDAFEPGSTFKIFVAAAALDAKVVKPGDKFHCENGEYYVSAKEVIHDCHPYGVLTVGQIIQKSSNIGAAKIAGRLGGARMDHYLGAFGFGNNSGIHFPGENSGLLKNLKRTRSPLDRATCAFGQGISVTPLQLVMAVSAIGNRGILMEPRLVKEVVDAHGRKVKEYPARVKRRVLSDQTAEQMLAIMETVTQEGGTAKNSAPPGFTAAGKTGTAQKLVNRAYSHNKYNSLFIGMVPAHDPVLAIAVIIDEPKGAIYGGVVAAPIFKEIATQSLRVLGYYPKTNNPPVLASLFSSTAFAQNPPGLTEISAKPALPQGPFTVMPDLQGLTKRQVLKVLQRGGLNCHFEGSGRAVEQTPAPGSPISPGAICAVKFQSRS